MASLQQVAANNDGCGARSRVTFAATARTTYLVAVAGRDGDTWDGAVRAEFGPVVLRIDAPNPVVASTTQVAPSPATVGEPATATASVTSESGVPTVDVQFAVDGEPEGDPVTLTDGGASLVLPSCRRGSTE